MKAIQVPERGADLQLVERETPEPGTGQVRIRVLSCGVCHSDVVTKDGLLPGIAYPRVPGHEVAGVIDDVGAAVSEWKRGDRVGVGWHGGHDGTCLACRQGDFVNCVRVKGCGVDYDGGYQELMVAPVEALVRIPESLDAAEAAPLMCAGNTTFSALRYSGARPTELVAVQGLGGLGHLGVQFAKKLGFQVAAIGRGPQNSALAKRLGADVYVDSVATDAARELQSLGGARAILCTAPSGKAMSALVGGLGANGALVVVGASAEAIEVPPNALIFGRKRILGWLAGPPTDTEETLRFAVMTGVRPMIEKYPLARAAEAYARMLSGKAEFRAVLTM
jgi:D-arabinose 1-dehydrogenase-like Zn-dependent alcohol dehydrogenase